MIQCNKAKTFHREPVNCIFFTGGLSEIWMALTLKSDNILKCIIVYWDLLIKVQQMLSLLKR